MGVGYLGNGQAILRSSVAWWDSVGPVWPGRDVCRARDVLCLFGETNGWLRGPDSSLGVTWPPGIEVKMESCTQRCTRVKERKGRWRVREGGRVEEGGRENVSSFGGRG